MAVCDLSVNVGLQPLDPATHLPLMKMQYADPVLEDKFAKAGALNFFQPEVDTTWRNSPSISQSIRLRYKDYQNPFDVVGVKPVEYKDGVSCPAQLDVDCGTCISTENSWRYADVLYKNEFQVGIQWCVKQEKLLYQDAESRWNESVEAATTVQSTVGWSELICQAIDEAATTLLPAFRNVFPTHYFDAGSADQYDTLTQVFNYMKRVYGGRFNSDFVIVAHPQLELDLANINSNWHQYDKTGIPTAQANTDVFVAGGFSPMTLLPRNWGHPILIAPDVVDWHPSTGSLSGSNLSPFENADGSKYYVVIVSKRAYFHGAITLMDKTYFPPNCADGKESIQQVWMSYYKLLFPKEIFVVAFDYDGGVSS